MSKQHNLEHLKELLETTGELFLRVKVRPERPHNQLRDIREESIDGKTEIMCYVDIMAKPEQGKANVALCAFLASLFDIDSTQVHVILGKREGLKVIKISL